MKRRIIGSILVIVMLVLSLASCAYSFANDNELATYAPFTAEEKAALEAAIAAIKIEDGDFTTDPATRAQKVIESINAAFANAAKNNEKLKEGTPNALLDLVYYCYYASAVKDGTTYYFYATNMKDSSAKNLQLGKSEYDTDLEEAVANALATLDFTDKTYTSTTTSTVTGEDGKPADVLAKAGQLVFVSYKISYMEKAEDGTEKEKTATFTNHPVIVKELAKDATATSLEEYLFGKKNNTTLDKQTFTVNGVETKYTDIKINWVANGSSASSFTDTLEESLTTTTTEGSKTFDEGTEVTYYIYPIGFIEVEEYNATNLLNTILGESITYDLVIATLFGEDYVDLDEEDEDDKKKIEELKELVKAYESKDKDGKTVTLEEFVKALSKLQGDLDDAKTALEDAEENLEKALEAKEKADKAVTNAGDKVTDKLKDEQSAANDDYALAEANKAKASTAFDDAKKARDEKVTAFLALASDMEEKIVKGYKRYTYDYLQYQYQNEIRNKLAKEIYFFLNKYITITGVPEGAIELTYKQLMENHEYDFYTGDASSDQTNYNKYLNKGMFKGYLQDKMNANSYEEACKLVREEAKKMNEPLVRIYRAAAVYGVLVTDKDFEDYKKNDETSYYYTYYESSYGENSVRHAYQFDQLLNYWLDYDADENEKAPADENGYVMQTVKYKGIASYEFGTPASEVKEESTDK